MATSDRGIVIVGGGAAGWRCCFALRERGFEGPITLVCRESWAPYDRTMVTKDCLVRRPEMVELALATESEYRTADVEVHAGVEAVSLDVERRRVLLSDGEFLSYESVVVTTGGRPRVPAALGCSGVHTLRSLEDAQRFSDALVTGSRLTIVGGGFIAGEAATAALDRGVEVMMLETLEAPLARALGAEVGRRIEQLHRDAGVEVVVRAAAERVRRCGSRYCVQLRGGRQVNTDVVLVATGMTPAVEWLAGTPGLRLDDGIVTDEHCRAGAPGVFAAGDCARWWNRRTGRLTRVEHWSTAVEHGAAAAAALTGGADPFVPLPFVWSIQHGARLQWVGDAGQWDRVTIDEDAGSATVVARYWRDGALVAGFAINDPLAIATIRQELARREKVDATTEPAPIPD